MRIQKHTLALVAAATFIAACEGSDGPGQQPPAPGGPPPAPAMATFDVTVSNLTNAQPLSPVAVIGHIDGYNVFTIGTAATNGLEILAEGGNNATLITEAGVDANVLVTGSGAAPIGPAGSETVTIQVLASDVPRLQISTATMLVNTNDAITVLNAADVSGLAAGDVWSTRTIAYDAGTEADSEEAIHIPGPAGGGEGFNAARDDEADRVSMHTGVVGQDDGFATSDLNNQHKFDNPVAGVRIERIN